MPASNTCAVVTQSNYIPWRGYFDLMRQADRFVLLDCVQYTRRDWRNRNKIKTPQGATWLTVPVATKGRFHQAVDDVHVQSQDWADQHWRSIKTHYARAGAFDGEGPWLQACYQEAAKFDRLSAINAYLLTALRDRLGLSTPIDACDTLLPRADLTAMTATQRLVELCLSVGASRYLTGESARGYLDTDAFAAAGIDVVWMQYGPYAEYPQCWDGFDPGLSIIDLLLNVGHQHAGAYLQPVSNSGAGS